MTFLTSCFTALGAVIMRKTSTSGTGRKKNRPQTKLGIPDLEHSKAAVLRSLASPDSRRGYQHAIDEFVGTALNHEWHSTKQWFCAIGFTWKDAVLHLGRSTCAWPLCVGLLMKQQIVAF